MPGELVLLHGFTQTGRSWAPVAERLSERYRSFAPDLPGHGDATWRRPVSFDAISAYLRALHHDRFTLAGYSMGGRLALDFALRHPERVEQLLLVGASPGIAGEAERRTRRAADLALAERIEGMDMEAFATEWGSQPLLGGMPRGVAALVHADRLRNIPSGLAASLRGVGTGAMTPLWDRLGELAMPVTLMVGERDEKFTAIARAMAERMPHARVVAVPGAGHAAHLEAPDAVAGALAQ
jgi:2-succinyl-6-hydroxy-2,4-cyclohexadiene-1-carboxylate synthase